LAVLTLVKHHLGHPACKAHLQQSTKVSMKILGEQGRSQT